MKGATVFSTLTILGKPFFVLLTTEVLVHLLCIIALQVVTCYTYEAVIASSNELCSQVAAVDVKVGNFVPNVAGVVVR